MHNIYTSYFGNTTRLLREFEAGELVNIARVPPMWFTGMKNVRSYRILAPSWELLGEWNQGRLTEEQYVQRFQQEVLAPLDASVIVKDLLLGHTDCVLLCYEGPGKFCHRHIVARWLKANAGVDVSELKF